MSKQNYKIFSSVSDISGDSFENNKKDNNREKTDLNLQLQAIEKNVKDNKLPKNNNKQQEVKEYQQNFIEKYNNRVNQREKITINTQKKNQLKLINKEQQIKEENKKILLQMKQQSLNQQVQIEISSSEQEFQSEEINEEDEYKKWKIRELKRIKRDKILRLENEEKPNANIQQIHKNQQYKSDYKYMQKYYKSMTYFQNEDDPIYKRDYNVAVGFDTFDKSQLPKYLQVRGDEFGKKGRSKYKDLNTEDTNTYDNYYNIDKKILQKIKKN